MVTSVHSTRVVFIPSKDKIRVRVPMDAHGGLLYMVAYNLRKVENRDRYPDPPVAYYRRNSLVAGLRVVAAAAWVRFPVSAMHFFYCRLQKKNGPKKGVKLEGFEPTTFRFGLQCAAIAP